jgi:hypothetical protein
VENKVVSKFMHFVAGSLPKPNTDAGFSEIGCKPLWHNGLQQSAFRCGGRQLYIQNPANPMAASISGEKIVDNSHAFSIVHAPIFVSDN